MITYFDKIGFLRHILDINFSLHMQFNDNQLSKHHFLMLHLILIGLPRILFGPEQMIEVLLIHLQFFHSLAADFCWKLQVGMMWVAERHSDLRLPNHLADYFLVEVNKNKNENTSIFLTLRLYRTDFICCRNNQQLKCFINIIVCQV